MNLLVNLVMFAGLTVGSDHPSDLNEHLSFFKPLCGKTYRGEFAQSTPEKPQVDIMRVERAMNGQAVRIVHSVNDGAYGGESILMWDKETKKLRFWYFTTAGFFTTGTMETRDNQWTTVEKVTGNAGGVTEVRSTSIVEKDGRMTRKSEMFREGKWTPGHVIRYAESPGSTVRFK